MSDLILMHGLAFHGHHGVLPEETRTGQRFLVDVEMTVDTRAAGQSDDLTRTVDYGAVYHDVKAIVEGPPAQLIEKVAEDIAARVLGAYAVRSVRVRVRKPDAPIPGPIEYVAVEIVRSAAR